MTKRQKLSLALLWLSIFLQNYILKILTRRLHSPFHSPQDSVKHTLKAAKRGFQWGLAEAFKVSIFCIKLPM